MYRKHLLLLFHLITDVSNEVMSIWWMRGRRDGVIAVATPPPPLRLKLEIGAAISTFGLNMF